MAINIFAMSGLGACGPAAVFALLAVVLPYLESNGVRVRNVTMDTSITLWRSCDEFGETDMCEDTLNRVEWSDGDKKALRAARAMVLLGLFASIATLAFLILFLSYMKNRRLIGLIGGGLSVAGGIMFMITVAIVAGKLKTDDHAFSAGFAFSILSWFATWTGAALIFLAVARNTGEISVLLI